MNYGSPFYIGSIALLLILTGLLWFLFRKCSEKTQKKLIFAFMAINTLQHFLKPIIYPQYWGMGFSSLSTAYNMCAVLIILSPFVYVSKNRFLKNFVLFIGSVAGIGAIAIPVWYIGMPVQQLGWDYLRFYICHALLFISSILPLLLKHHTASYKEFWQIGLGFLMALSVILINDVIFMSIGLFPGADAANLYQSLLQTNPCMMMGPKESFSWLVDIIKYMSPSVFLGNNAAGQYAPILWYAIPLYIGISIISFVVFILVDWKHFKEDIMKLKRKKGES